MAILKFSAGMVGGTFIALGAAAPSYATTLSVGNTYGDTMAGIEVTAGFLDGGSQAVTWSATGPNAGGVSGSDWSLSVSGDTFFAPWTLSNTGQGIVSLVINAIPGNTVFDTIDTLVEPPSTPLSARGIPLTVVSGPAPTSFAYSDPIDISAGDLFGTLSVSYSAGFTGTATYRADTDSGTGVTPVPEPTTLLGTLVLGVLGTGSLLKRRKLRV